MDVVEFYNFLQALKVDPEDVFATLVRRLSGIGVKE